MEFISYVQQNGMLPVPTEKTPRKNVYGLHSGVEKNETGSKKGGQREMKKD